MAGRPRIMAIGPERRPITTKSQKDRIQDKQIKHLQRQISGMKPEIKYIDYNNTTVPTGGYVAFCYSLIAQGDDFNNRIGEEVRAKKLELYITINRPATTAVATSRTIVLWDTQNNGETVFNHQASTNITEGLLDDTTITNVGAAPFNYRCKDRYKILMDKRIVWSPNEPTCVERHVIRKNINLSNAVIKFSDSGATTASLPSRALIVLHVGLDVGVTSTHATTGRLWYSD